MSSWSELLAGNREVAVDKAAPAWPAWTDSSGAAYPGRGVGAGNQ